MNSPRNRIEHLFDRRETQRERAPRDPFEALFRVFLPEFYGHAVQERQHAPKWDVHETEDHFEVRLGVPGYSKEDIKVAVENGALVVRAKHDTEGRSSTFTTALALPEGVDSELIQAEMKNGLLRLTIPKPESHKPKEIEIKDIE